MKYLLIIGLWYYAVELAKTTERFELKFGAWSMALIMTITLMALLEAGLIGGSGDTLAITGRTEVRDVAK